VEVFGEAFVAAGQAAVVHQPGRRVGHAARCQLGWSFSAWPPSEPDVTFKSSGSPVITL
jgi:hypothetical protein